MTGVLQGLRVLDFGRYIAGPYCACLLGDLGADVIRVERLEGGEDRGLYPVTQDGGALFLQVNRNKRGMTLNVKAPGGADVLHRLLATADVVVANMPDGALRDMGLDYESLCAVRPDIILTAISAFGPGPYADKLGFDGIGQAMSGAAWLSGHSGEPMKSFASWVDFTTALLASHATLAAIYERSRTGRGQRVQASLFTSALTVMNAMLIEHAATDIERTATGNRAQSGGPADVLPTSDGWIMVQVIGDGLFRRVARLVGEPSWLDDPRFATDALRAENGALLSEGMKKWSAQRTTREALDQLADARIPAGPVMSPRQVLVDEHVLGSGMLTPMDYPGVAAPAPLVMGAAALSRRAPTLSEHTQEVLRSLGYSAGEIEALRSEQAIR